MQQVLALKTDHMQPVAQQAHAALNVTCKPQLHNSLTFRRQYVLWSRWTNLAAHTCARDLYSSQTHTSCRSNVTGYAAALRLGNWSYGFARFQKL
jgi:hypothetical protein